MRRLVVLLTLAVAAVIVVDLAAPSFVGLERGSVGIEPQSTDLELLPFEPVWDDPECAEPRSSDDESCALRYAFRAGSALTVWLSVRNAGPVPIRLHGVSDDWLEQFTDVSLLAQPVAGVDGGDPHRPGTLAELVPRPFAPVTLAPGDERLLGIEIVMTDDVKHACEHWEQGSAVGWDSVPLSWSLIGLERDQDLTFAAPVSFMAPTEEDCS